MQVIGQLDTHLLLVCTRRRRSAAAGGGGTAAHVERFQLASEHETELWAAALQVRGHAHARTRARTPRAGAPPRAPPYHPMLLSPSYHPLTASACASACMSSRVHVLSRASRVCLRAPSVW